jgi:hypothetical protein
MSQLLEAYQEHGLRMQQNLAERFTLYDFCAKNKKAQIYERHLCSEVNEEYEGIMGEKTGILRFFHYHLFTHEPRPNVRAAYGHGFENVPSLPFLLFPFQEEAVLKICEAIDTGHDLLIEKSRDMGVTWLVVCAMYWYWWKNEPGSEFLLGSRKLEYVDKKDSADTLFEKFRYNLYKFDNWFSSKKFDSNKNDNVAFIYNPDNENFARGEANNANFGTSGRYKAVFMDEFSKWEETDDQAWTSTGDSSPCRIAVSTPWGIGRKFGQLRFSDAIEVLTFHWSEHPIKGAGKYEGDHPYIPDKKSVWLSEWYLAECERRKDNPAANIGQELDIDYLSSGTPYFNNRIIQERFLKIDYSDIIKRYDFDRVEAGVELREDSNGRIGILEEPEPGYSYRYCIAADVAEGLEKGDNSVMYVYDRLKQRDVAKFIGKVDTTIFAYLLSYFGWMYDDAYIAVESNNQGHAVLQVLKQIYQNLYYEGEFTKVVDMEKQRLGWNTNVVSRPIMCGDLRNAINEGKEGVFDKQFYQECLTFVYNKNGKAEADQGCLDDRVMAQAVKFQVHKWLSSPIEKTEHKEKEYDAPRFGGVWEKKEKKDIRTIWR